MGKDRNLFERYDVAIFLAVSFAMVLSYPFLDSTMCSHTFFYFLFITWIAIIVFLMAFMREN